MGKIKVNEIEKHDATEVTVNSDVVMAAGTSVSSPSISTDTISEKTSANGVVIDGVTLKDSKIGGTITIPGSTGTMALTSDITSGLAVADQYDITSNITSTQSVITNWARPTHTLNNNLGSGVTESSGIFSFPSTGFYYVNVFVTGNITSSSPGTAYFTLELYTTNDNFSSEDKVFNISIKAPANQSHMAQKSTIIDVTDVSNDKVKLTLPTLVNTISIAGTTTETRSAIQFFKLGDT